jgi:hypothetical protein
MAASGGLFCELTDGTPMLASKCAAMAVNWFLVESSYETRFAAFQARN